MKIGQIQRVTDLDEDQRAFPEQGTAYGLRSIDNAAVDTDVECVMRRGNCLIARGKNGEDFPVSGVGAFVMTPRPIAALR